jgi:hypothetical protein
MKLPPERITRARLIRCEIELDEIHRLTYEDRYSCIIPQPRFISKKSWERHRKNQILSLKKRHRYLKEALHG